MVTAIVKYEGELRTSMTHLFSSSTVGTDAPLDNRGLAQLFSPTDLVAAALGSCMLTIMGIKARDMNLAIEGTTADVTKVMASDPRRISTIKVTIKFPEGNFSESEKKILQNAAMACPVAKSLHPDIHQDVSFVWH